MPKNVTVSYFLHGEAVHVLMTERDTPCEALVFTWKTMRDSEEHFRITVGAEDGPEIGDGKVEDLLTPGQPPVIALYVKEVRAFELFIIGLPNLEVKTRAHSLSTPEALIADVKEEFGIDELRVARLKCRDKILEPEVPLGEQADETLPIGFDLELKFTVDEMAAAKFEKVLFIDDKETRPLLTGLLPEESRRHVMVPQDPFAIPAFYKKPPIWSRTVYASETCLKLLPNEPSVDEELRFTRKKDSRQGYACDTVTKLLSDEEILKSSCAQVTVERKMAVEVNNLITKKITWMAIWPSMSLKQLVTKPTHTILVGAERIESNQTAAEAGLQDHSSLTITKFQSINVIDSSGEVHKMNVNLSQSVMDLRVLLSKFESNDTFKMWLDNHKLLCDGQRLIDAGFKKGSIVTLSQKTRDVKLLIKEQALARLTVRQGTPFKAFMEMAGRALRRQLPNDTRFICECGRVLSCESAARKVFPMRCCPTPVPSFKLEIPENQKVRGHKTSSKFRAPRTERLDKQLERITTLNSCENEAERQRTEAKLIKDCLFSEKATSVEVTYDDRLDLGLEVDNKRTLFPVWPCDTMFSALMEIQKTEERRVLDFAVNRHERLFVGMAKKRTFADAGLSRGETLTVVFQELKDGSTQFDLPRSRAAIQVSPGHKNHAALRIGERPHSATFSHPPTVTFRIRWFVDDDEEFDLTMTCGGGLKAADVRKALAARKQKKASELELRQKLGRGRDGRAVVWADVGEGECWVTADGEEVKDDDVEGKFVTLEDSHVLMTPPSPFRPYIFVYNL